jgi:hypothetical protein
MGRFLRSVRAANLLQAEVAAREMGQLQLGHALALCRLMSEANDPRAERAALRWVARYLAETDLATLAEAQLMVAAVAAARDDAAGWALVEQLASRHGVRA